MSHEVLIPAPSAMGCKPTDVGNDGDFSFCEKIRKLNFWVHGKTRMAIYLLHRANELLRAHLTNIISEKKIKEWK
jgi:hypothetical protein